MSKHLKKHRFVVLCFWLVLYFFVSNSPQAFAEFDSSSAIRDASSLVKERQFAKAVELLQNSIEQAPKSEKLWYTFSLVELANNDQIRALEIMYVTRLLNPDFEGLEKKISQLEGHITRTHLALNLELPDFAGLIKKAQRWLSFELDRFKYKSFIFELLSDRSILASNRPELSEGYNFFYNPSNQFQEEEQLLYQGFYSFFSGSYPQAKDLFNTFCLNFPDSQHKNTIDSLLKEIEQIEEGLATHAKAYLPDSLTKDIDSPISNSSSEPAPTKHQQHFTSNYSLSSPTVSDLQVPYAYMSSDQEGDLPNKTADELYDEAYALYHSDPVEAVRLLEIVLRKGPPKPEYLLTLGYLSLTLPQEREKARIYFQRVLILFPNTEHYHEAQSALNTNQ